MKSLRNIETKIKVTYPKLIRDALSRGDEYTAKFWENKLSEERAKLVMKMINLKKLKNGKGKRKKSH